GRLGIPLTISTDPRNHFQVTAGASVVSTGFSKWPETLGFGAIGDPDLVRRFAAIIAREYRAVGIHMALSPQADLATEPRWSRINGTFGEDPERVRALVKAYVQGLQGDPRRLTSGGVAAVVKHWVGYGAAVDGFDGHNFYGRYSRFQSGQFDAHVVPFKGAFEAGVAGVMPTYNIVDGVMLDGRPLEAVGAGFNAQLLTDLLRQKHGFRGLVLSDWAITRDCPASCRTGAPPQPPQEIAMPWGVESLSTMERFAKGMNAGIDQFGGIDDGAPLEDAVRGGLVPRSRLDEAVTGILNLKFDLGLFENPFVDPDKAAAVVGAPESQRQATAAQAQAMVVLKRAPGRVLLPKPESAIFLHGIDTATARARGFRIVDDAAHADVAVIRLTAPFQTLHPGFFFGRTQHEGDLDFKEDDAGLALVRASAAVVPTIVVVYLDRPAILTSLKPLAKALIGEFGISDGALFDALTGRVMPVGRLPFELPGSMIDVRRQSPGAPHDSRAPLYPLGYRAPR
ncbi:MAG: glycoside hydrolase family 3 N-terminal domain-containing protein, partial [Gemmatimonadaceae bacterium]